MKSTESKIVATVKSGNVTQDPASVADSKQAAPESPESEVSQTIRRVRKLMEMPNVSDADLLDYLKIVLDRPQGPANAATSSVRGCGQTAPESQESAFPDDPGRRHHLTPEETEAMIEKNMLSNPEDFDTIAEPIYTGEDVAEIIRRVEIESAEVTAFDMVRLFLNQYPNAKAGLALFAVAAKFAAK